MQLETDYLAVQQHLISHLSPLKGIRKVYGSQDIASVDEKSQIAPAIHVLYGGDQIADEAQGGHLSKVTQVWQLVLVVNDAKAHLSGELLMQIVRRMAGFHPVVGNFNRVRGPAPRYRKGYAYYPLNFQITLTIQGERRL